MNPSAITAISLRHTATSNIVALEVWAHSTGAVLFFVDIGGNLIETMSLTTEESDTLARALLRGEPCESDVEVCGG